VHQIRKALAEHGDKVEAGEKEKIEAAIKDVEEALKGEDKEALEAKTAALMTVSQKLGEKMYAQAGAGAEQGGAQPGPGAAAGGGSDAKNDDVVDADYKEVKRG
jgi:molecular chaperone DnaK